MQALDLKELLRQKGKHQSEVGVNQTHVSLIANGLRRAGADAIKRMAAALACSTDEVFAACEESFRRAQSSDLAAVPTPAGTPISRDAGTPTEA